MVRTAKEREQSRVEPQVYEDKNVCKQIVNIRLILGQLADSY